MAGMPTISKTLPVKDYWEQASCGTNRTKQAKHSGEYFAEIEEFRYRHEPYIHSFAQFTRWRKKDVLEIGVGAGTDFTQFVRAGARAHGVDLTEESIANVRARLHTENLEAAELRVCNAEQLPYEDGTFDLVYSWGVVHHVENVERVLDEIYRVTKPGGSIKIMVYNLNSLHAWYMCLRHGLLRGRPFRSRRWAVYHFQESYATRLFSRRDIRQLLKRYPHSDLRFRFWDQHIRQGARWEGPRRLIQALTPVGMRWYMPFEFRKEG